MAIRRVALGAAAVLLLAIALSSSVASAEQSSSSSLMAAEAGEISGRELLAILAKKKSTKAKGKKKPTAKIYYGSKCTSKGLKGCATCTSKACKVCKGAWKKTKLNHCVCKTGYVYNKSKTQCVKKALAPKPTKAKPTAPKPTGKIVVPPPTGSDGPDLQPNARDPVPSTPKAPKTTCKGTTAGGLKFQVMSKLVDFAGAEAVCKGASLRLPTIDDIFAGSSASIGAAAQSTIQSCLGSNQMVWFDTTLAKPDCQAFMNVAEPSDGGAATGRKLRAASTVLTSLSVPGGCPAKLPVLCV